MKKYVLAAALCLSAFSTSAATIQDPLSLPGATVGANLVVATDGHVFATFIGSDAALTSELFLDGSSLGAIFNNHTSTPGGAAVDLGFFTAGTVLKFFITVADSTPYNVYSGPASNNSDGLAHALVADLGSGETFVGFEDILNYAAGTADFNDLEYSFTNVGAAAVPLPAGGILLLTGLGGLAALRRRRR